MKQILTIPEAAKVLRITARWLRINLTSGAMPIPVIRLSERGRALIRSEDLEKYIASRRFSIGGIRDPQSEARKRHTADLVALRAQRAQRSKRPAQ